MDSNGCSLLVLLLLLSILWNQGDTSMHLLLRSIPLYLYPHVSVGRRRTCSFCSVPPSTSMLGGTSGTLPSTAALPINRISNNIADAKLLSSTRLPFTPNHLKSLGFTPSPPHLALLSLFFLLYTAIGAMFSLAIISLPTIIAFRRLGASVQKLSQVVFDEVPGTLSSLKLYALEIDELTQQLTNLRQRISATD